MGIQMAYVAPDPSVKGCQKPPTDVINVQPAALRGEKFRTEPPVFTVPLTGIDPQTGKAVEIQKPPGPIVPVQSGHTISVNDFYFKQPNVSLPQGSRLNWRFGSGTLHNVTLASGPRGFSSPNLSDDRRFSYTFRVPGTYKIFCGLHPVSMTETVTVK
jgi:plastocyanin